MADRPGWGGPRAGSGRKPGEAPPMETVTVRLTRAQLAWLSAKPDSFSVTLRALVQAAMDADRLEG